MDRIMIQIVLKMVESATWVFWFVSSIIFHGSPCTIFGTQAKEFPLHMAKKSETLKNFSVASGPKKRTLRKD